MKDVVLRPTMANDLDFVTAAESDPENRPFVLQWPREQHAAAINSTTCAHRIVEDASSRQSVGYAILLGLGGSNRSIEFRRLVITAKGCGYGRAAVRAIQRLAFEELGAHRLWLDVKEFNLRARRLYESEGFKTEGLLRECYLGENGFESVYIMSVLDSEYPSLRLVVSATCPQEETNHLGQPIGFVVPDWRFPPRPTRSTLHGRFCRLEPLDPPTHAASLYAAQALDVHGGNWTYLSYGPFETLERYLAWMNQCCCGKDPMFYAIVDRTQGKALGVASYMRIDPDNGSMEVGHLNFSPLLQRTPAATEAMYLMMKHAFELGYRRYEWKCNAHNAASRAAARRLGFSFEGIFRQATVVKGRNRDTAWYAAIDQDWPALNKAFLQWLDPSNFDEKGNQRMRLSVLTEPNLKKHG